MTATVWNEGTDEASSRRGGRSSGRGPGLGTTTFTVSQAVGGKKTRRRVLHLSLS